MSLFGSMHKHNADERLSGLAELDRLSIRQRMVRTTTLTKGRTSNRNRHDVFMCVSDMWLSPAPNSLIDLGSETV